MSGGFVRKLAFRPSERSNVQGNEGGVKDFVDAKLVTGTGEEIGNGTARIRSGPKRPIQGAILDRFGNVLRFNTLRAFKIRNCPGYLQNAVVGREQ